MHYQISRDGQLFGPYTLEDLQRYLATGNVLSTDLARATEDPAAAWIPVSQLLSATPPPPLAITSDQSSYKDSFLYGAAAQERTGDYPWFPVSPIKFFVMSLCTFGMYHVYWSYKQWTRVSAHTGESMMPWARAIFLGIWNFGLFDRVHDDAASRELTPGWVAVPLGIAIILFGVCARLPPPFSALVFLSVLAYLPVVSTIQKINASHTGQVSKAPNTNFSALNIVGIVLGGILLLLSFIGMFLGKH